MESFLPEASAKPVRRPGSAASRRCMLDIIQWPCLSGDATPQEASLSSDAHWPGDTAETENPPDSASAVQVQWKRVLASDDDLPRKRPALDGSLTANSTPR
jgi:hypothetical protein